MKVSDHHQHLYAGYNHRKVKFNISFKVVQEFIDIDDSIFVGIDMMENISTFLVGIGKFEGMDCALELSEGQVILPAQI